jgi:hypothetical protein
MLREFRDYANKVLLDTETKHKIIPTYTVENWRLTDELWAKDLPEKLKDIGYRLSEYTDKKGYHEVFQPQEKFCSTIGDDSRNYGHISKKMLQIISRY